MTRDGETPGDLAAVDHLEQTWIPSSQRAGTVGGDLVAGVGVGGSSCLSEKLEETNR